MGGDYAQKAPDIEVCLSPSSICAGTSVSFFAGTQISEERINGESAINNDVRSEQVVYQPNNVTVKHSQSRFSLRLIITETLCNLVVVISFTRISSQPGSSRHFVSGADTRRGLRCAYIVVMIQSTQQFQTFLAMDSVFGGTHSSSKVEWSVGYS